MKLDKNKLNSDFITFSKDWVDTQEYNRFIYDYFDKQVDLYPSINNHTNIVGEYQLGYGEKAFRYLWSLIFSQINSGSKFLEIGVFKGSILALSQLISKELDIELFTYGLTPLDAIGDKYSNYVIDDYEYSISFLYHKLDLAMDNTMIIPGLSTDQDIKNLAKNQGPYDILYIDGGHDYDTVVNDINLCNEILKPGGLMIMDDASSLLNLPSDHKGFAGHNDVGYAIRDHIDNKNTYKHLFACGHNRVWKKLL